MEMQGDQGFGNYSTCNGDIQEIGGDKFMQYSADQVMVLEQLYVECQKPSHALRIAMIRENSLLSNLNSQQIQAWFENRRFVEKKKKDAFVFNLLNEKMTAIGRLVLLENDFLRGEVQQLLREKEYIRKLLQYASLKSFLALEVQRSVFQNVKTVAKNRLLLLKNDYLHYEVQQLHKEKEYILNLLENLTNCESIVNSYLSWSAAARSSKGYSSMLFTEGKSNQIINKYILLCEKDVSVTWEDTFKKNAMGWLLQDIKLVLQGPEESSTAVVPAFLPQGLRVLVSRYCVLGAWSYFPNEPAALGNVKFVLCFKCLN